MLCVFCFFFYYTATTETYLYLHTLSLHAALPISSAHERAAARAGARCGGGTLRFGAWAGAQRVAAGRRGDTVRDHRSRRGRRDGAPARAARETTGEIGRAHV